MPSSLSIFCPRPTCEGTKSLIIATLKSAGYSVMCAEATYGLLMNIFFGKPEIAAQAAKALAAAQVPAVAIPVALIVSLYCRGVDRLETIDRVIRSAATGLVSAGLLVPLTMQAITRFVQIVNDMPRDSMVMISPAAAGTIIGGCLTVGFIQFVQQYYKLLDLEVDNREKSCGEKLVMNKPMQAVFGFIKGCSSFHGAAYLTQSLLLGHSLFDLTFQDLGPYYLRTSMATLGGVLGAGAELYPNSIIGQSTNLVEAVFGLYVLGVNQILFLFSDTAEETLGSTVIIEQWITLGLVVAMPYLLEGGARSLTVANALLDMLADAIVYCYQSLNTHTGENKPILPLTHQPLDTPTLSINF